MYVLQAQQQALADRRKAFAIPEAAMKGTKEQTGALNAGLPNGLQVSRCGIDQTMYVSKLGCSKA